VKVGRPALGTGTSTCDSQAATAAAAEAEAAATDVEDAEEDDESGEDTLQMWLTSELGVRTVAGSDSDDDLETIELDEVPSMKSVESL
jgi:hypothetical protein